MPAPSWKDRLTDKQLAKKRLSDKLTQRRLRQQSRYIMVETERHIDLVSSGQLGTLINCLLQDNAALRAKISGYQASLESIVDEVKTCLESDYDDWNDLNSGNWFGINPGNATQTDPSHSLTYLPDEDDLPQARAMFCRPETSRSSVFLNELLESAMTWKSLLGYTDGGLQFLLDCTGLNQEPWNMTIDQLNERSLSKNLFPDILENLLYGFEIPPPTGSAVQEPLLLSEPQRLRRAVAVCAYERSRRWRKLIKTPLEYVSIFWGDYTYFLLLIFPTVENYERMPSWKKPVPLQFRLDHPDIVDFIICIKRPKLRTHMAANWTKYDLADVYLKLAQSLQIQDHDDLDTGTAFTLTADMSDICLGPEFEKAVDDPRNFGVDSRLAEYYPELAALIHEASSDISPATPSSPITSIQRLKRDSASITNKAPAKKRRVHRTPSVSTRLKGRDLQSLSTSAGPAVQDYLLVDPQLIASATAASATAQEGCRSLPDEADHGMDMLWLEGQSLTKDDSWMHLGLDIGLDMDPSAGSMP
ncbi:hypothetical protein BHE90_017520 [Fusarium euwallaceae]|uniref:BZIP domain-containing protein n=1 Tax=Fusarium euwallaceae TaxID=1147111 RepID=A0A430KXM8_9HYPO|nr:hypothetical protein BHE90_017520 [Fusarium euwallaceae]